MDYQFNLHFNEICNKSIDFANENNSGNNDSFQMKNLYNNSYNNFEQNEFNEEENDIPAPHISDNAINDGNIEEFQNKDSSSFSLLDSTNNFNGELYNIFAPDEVREQNNMGQKEDKSEKDETHFQMEDFVTPSGDNENIENSNNNQNSKVNLVNSSKNVIAMETPGNNNLSNSSSSQTSNKSSTPTPYCSSSNFTPLNNSSNNKNEIVCQTFSGDENLEENETPETPLKKTKTKKGKTKIKLEGVRKKIKARMHKRIKSYYNQKLKESGSKMFFDTLPQSFIQDVSIIKNKAYLNLTMRALLTMIFGTRAKDKEKININKKLLHYLDNNPDIVMNSGVDNFLNSLYRDIIKEYVEGELFEEDIEKLKTEKNSKEYIDKYIYIAKHLIEFYENGKILKTPKG